MTLKQIEKCKLILSKIDSTNGLREMQELASEAKAFFGDLFNVHLKVTTWNTPDTYSSEYEKNDKISIRNFLESLLAQDENASTMLDLLSLIEEGEQSKKDSDTMEKYISKVFYAYSGKITFDKMTEAIATAPQEILGLNMLQVSKEMVDGVITKLKTYAAELSRPKPSNKSSIQNKQEINFQPQIHVESKVETKINIEVVFKAARQKVADEGLSDAQTKEILDKINELEVLSKSSESKGSKWTKIKEIMKWLVEQGIAVAGILMPVITEVLK